MLLQAERLRWAHLLGVKHVCALADEHGSAQGAEGTSRDDGRRCFFFFYSEVFLKDAQMDKSTKPEHTALGIKE